MKSTYDMLYRGEERPMYGQIETTDTPHRGYAPRPISSLSGSS